jgi:carbon monoxide dehydrogenase subunit G
MELSNEFQVGVPPDQAWKVLTDVERIAPCMPGAELKEIEGDEYRGVVKVKVGPITAQYKGKATFVEQDEAAGRVVLRAEGRDTRGQGNANATITATMYPQGSGTHVSVVTDLTVTGKVAQFGRGVLADVSAKLLGQFVDCLEKNVLSGSANLGVAPGSPASPQANPSRPAPPSPPPAASPPEPAGPAPSPTIAATATAAVPAGVGGNGSSADAESSVRRIEGPEAAPVDLLEAAGGSVAKRLVPAVLGLVAIVYVVIRWSARRRGR